MLFILSSSNMVNFLQDYDAFTSPPVHISPLDLGPKCADKLGGLPHKYQKTYMGGAIAWGS